jgi:hypothetical protein
MTADLPREHADAISRLRQLADLTPRHVVSRAFVASLSTRALEARSALGSYALARVMPEHLLAPIAGAFATICNVCGWSRMPSAHEDLEVETHAHFAAERRRYGGVRHLDPRYAAYDLAEFQSLPPLYPTAGDWRILELILRTPPLLSPEAKAADLERALKSILPSNKDERGVLIRILAYAGVLEAPGYPSFFDGYVHPDARDLPPQRFADWGYPTTWWRARHGVRADAVAYWFPETSGAHAA